MSTNCQARFEGGGMMRCVTCRVAWDSDDPQGACPRARIPAVEAPPLVPVHPGEKVVVVATRALNERLPFKSGLPDDLC